MPHHLGHHRLKIKLLTKRQQKELLKKSVLAVAVIEPMMTIPQVYEIWIKKNAQGVSSTTWILYISAAIVWLLYGIQLKDKPLIISSTLWLITEAGVVAGTLLYG